MKHGTVAAGNARRTWQGKTLRTSIYGPQGRRLNRRQQVDPGTARLEKPSPQRSLPHSLGSSTRISASVCRTARAVNWG